MIINVSQENFGGVIRNGDLIALANIVEHLRKSNPHTKFYLKPGTLSGADYCHKFFNFLLKQTDYFSAEEGKVDLHWKKVNIWDFRDISGDLVSIPNNEQVVKNKIVVFPVLDAPYNTYRNWPKDILQSILKESSSFYEKKILCVKDQIEDLDLHGFEISTDFMANIEHIMTCHTFVGGDTGTSHFASALDRGPIDLVYYYSSRGLIHTMPFYLLDGKGTMKTYWGNFEGTTW